MYFAADPGGGLWAAVTPVGAPEADPIVARYAQGDWSLFPEATGLSSLTLGPGGSVCGMAEWACAWSASTPQGTSPANRSGCPEGSPSERTDRCG